MISVELRPLELTALWHDVREIAFSSKLELNNSRMLGVDFDLYF
jgi:hypothetical protein